MSSEFNLSKLYIEFVGQHTAGKTTVIQDIVDRGLLEPKIAIYPQKIKRSRINFIIRLPFLFLSNIFDIFFIFKFLLCNVKFNWTNYHSAGRHMWKMVILHPYFLKFDFDVWMKDDLLHLLPRLEFKKNVDVYSALTMFFEHFEHWYDGLVFIDLPYEEMKIRFDKRFENRTEHRRTNRAEVYERAFAQNILLKGILQRQVRTPILILDGNADVKVKSAQVVEFIQDILHEKK